jgi:hypothetical protein
MNENSLQHGGSAPRNEPLYPSGKGPGRAAAPASAATAPTTAPTASQAATPSGTSDAEPAPGQADAGRPISPDRASQAPDEEDSLLKRLAAQDEARPGFPGEHWVALGLGVALLIYAARRGSGSPLLRSLATTAGTGLIARAASGRDGLRSLINP